MANLSIQGPNLIQPGEPKGTYEDLLGVFEQAGLELYDEIDKKIKSLNGKLFTVELPLIKTNEELEKIKQMCSKCDPYFITSGCCKKRKEKFHKLWKEYQLYADSHFLTQIKTNFHQRTWEMYVGNVLLEKKKNSLM